MTLSERGPALALAAALAIGCATRGADDASAAPIVVEIRFRGNRALSSKALKARILTEATSRLPFAAPKRFDPAVWRTDLARIQRTYERHGYYEAKVVDARVVPRPDNRVVLEVDIEEGAPVAIGRVMVGGLGVLDRGSREAAVEDLPLAVGTPFREADWEAAKRALRLRLRERGHVEAEVTGRAAVDIGTHRASLFLHATPGPRYRFGAIDVRVGPGGPAPPAWVREQVRLALREGGVFSDAALDEARRRVAELGVFSAVQISPGEPDRAAARLPVVVEARPGLLHTVRLGGGVAIDQIRQEGRVLGEWTDRDFLGRMRELTARLQVGWAFLPDLVSAYRDEGGRHGPLFRAGLGLTQPRLFERPTLRLRTLLEGERTLEQTFDALGARASVGVDWRPRSWISLQPSYNLQAYWLNGPRTASAASAPLALGCSTDPCFVILSFLEQVAIWDRRDNPIEPRRGHYLSLSLQEGGGPLGGDFRYLRVLPEVRGYVSPGEEGLVTLAARLRVGALFTGEGPEGSPVASRFYSGGGLWMRGFAIRRLSPLILLPADDSADPDARVALPIGGDGVLDGSLEARRRLFDGRLVAVLFADVGVVTPSTLGLSDILHAQWALGLGLRWVTPLGPLRIDVAGRLPMGRPPPLFDENGREITYRRLPGGGVEPGRESGANVDRSCFGIGGSSPGWVRDSLCAFHISVGEAF